MQWSGTGAIRTKVPSKKTWAQLFKINDDVSSRFVKISNGNITAVQIHCYILMKKCPLHCKGFSHFSTKITVHLFM